MSQVCDVVDVGVQAPKAESSSMSRLSEEIRDANLTYLMLAQQMLRVDRSEALYRLGISSEVADILLSLTTAQLLKIAGSSMLLARFRFDDSLVWNLLSSPKRDDVSPRIHAAILMAGRTAAMAAS